MEGTRNERVAILLASYFIGFVTAYIAFGVTQLEDNFKFVATPAVQTATVIQAPAVAPVPAAEQGVRIINDADGLSVVVDGEVTLLSVRVADRSDAEMAQGEHVAIAAHAVAPDMHQVYFCEVLYTGADSCLPSIYSLETEMLYPVTVDGQPVAFSSTKASSAWDANGARTVDQLPN
ncbi:MAG: hypothetical protein ACI9H6_000654 [Patiriisocius sp.]|jgi:hypothetical protein